METEKNYESMKRKELRQCLKEAREREEEERKILDGAEAFTDDYRKKQEQHEKACDEVEAIKKEIYKRNTKSVIIGIILLLLIIGTQQFLHKANIEKGQVALENGEYEDIYSVSWWPGVDFSFFVFKDHVRIVECNRMNREYITIPETIWFKPVTEISEYYFHNYNAEDYFRNTEKIVLADNIDNIKDEDGLIARIRANLLRWGEEGIAAYLTDVGVEDVEAVKEQLSFTEYDIADIKYVISRVGKEATEEEVQKAIDILINGGDIAQIPDFVYMVVKGKIGGKLENLIKCPYSITTWLNVHGPIY